jgi:hypothetical protein
MRRFVRPPSPALVLALIAMIVALSASAGALPGRDTIFRDDIRKDAVGASEIVAGGVGKPELREDSVGLSELREEGDPDGGLTGAHIVESSLGTVPRAATADHADTAERAALASRLAAPEEFRVVGAAGNPAFQNGCANAGGPYETAAFFKDHDGVVHLRGAVTCPGTGLPAFLLPPGYRPAPGKIHSELQTVLQAPNGIGPVVVDGSAGGVQTPNTTGQFVIDGIGFRAAG